ncbi:MAG: alpha/beta fold hydrolase [Thiogranum sp.]
MTGRMRLVVAGVTVTMLVAAFVGFMPVSGNLVRYLYWSRVHAAAAVDGRVDSGGTDIHFTSYGNGPPVLLLHGGLSNRLSWFSQLPWLVSSGRRVIVMDTRGHGRSGLGEQALSYRQLAADAVRVLDRLDVRCTDVIGWSDGANTALLVARGWPQRVGRVVAISGNYSPAGLTPEAIADSRQMSQAPVSWLRGLWTGAGGRVRRLEARVKRLWQTGPHLTDVDLRAIHKPILVIVGQKDQITLAHAREMAALLPDSQLFIVPAGGHATPVTHASQVNTAIAKFLGYQRKTGGCPAALLASDRWLKVHSGPGAKSPQDLNGVAVTAITP